MNEWMRIFCLFRIVVLLCCNAHDKRCTITVLYSSVGDDCLQDSDRVSGRNRRGSAPTERSKSLLRVTRPDFSVLCSPNLDFYWLDLLRKKTMHGKYNYQCTVLMAWHKCCSVWRTSVHSSQYDWTVFGTSIVRSAVVMKIWSKSKKYPDHGQTVKRKSAKEVAQPPNIRGIYRYL